MRFGAITTCVSVSKEKRPWVDLLSRIWPRVGPNLLPGPVCLGVWLFAVLLVWQLILLEQPGLALAAGLLSMLPFAPAASARRVGSAEALVHRSVSQDSGESGRAGPDAIEVEQVRRWWQCGPLLLVQLRHSTLASKTPGTGLSRTAYRVLWIKGAFEEPGRHLLRRLRMRERTSH